MQAIKKTTLILLGTAVLLAGTGCSFTKQETAKKEAVARWKGVRTAMALQIAEKQFQTGQMIKCRETLQAALKTQNEDPRVFVLLARVMFELQDLPAAEENLQAARNLNPNLAEVDYWQGVFAQSASQGEQAFKAYFAAYSREPGSIRYLIAMLESKLALGQARETVREAMDRFPEFSRSVQLRLIVANGYLVLNNYAKAEEFYQAALDIDSSNTEAREGLAHALYVDRKYSQAEPILLKLTTTLPPERTEVRFMLGNCYLATKQYPSAIRAYDACLEKDPQQPSVRLNLAKARLLNNQTDKARLDLLTLLRQEPENPHAWELLGHVYLRDKKYDQALDAYHQAIQRGIDRNKLNSFLKLCSGVNR
jgi:tetratricopeptide (TPR) repeat protein